MKPTRELNDLLENHRNKITDIPRDELIRETVNRKEAVVSATGCLAAWTPPESTGRSPKDTFIVRTEETENTIDWDAPNNIPMSRETFDMLWEDGLTLLKGKETLFETNRAVGADPSYAMPVKTISDKALTALFTMNMFRDLPDEMESSIFADKGFTVLVLPFDKVDASKYEGRLRKLPDGSTSNVAIAMDFTRRLGIVYGSAYNGSVKKMIFTVMNYFLPFHGILPIHCSANESAGGEVNLFLGLSGTGKTTLSADPERALLGDDEHGWNDTGVANFENGCYAKMIDLNPEKEPEIYNAVFHKDYFDQHGAIIENAMMYPDGTFDLCDGRLTQNSRASYPLTFLSNTKKSSTGGHPQNILFLTADANGVLPPVARLTEEQAMLWFLMGYTSKLAGTETGIVDPVSTFSRFFGAPFMPSQPHVYSDLLGKKMREHKASVFLVNTGWSGGPYGVGKRMDINLTRAIVSAILSNRLDNVEYREDPLFHLNVPKTCPGVPEEVLTPENTWADKAAYRERAEKLAREFSDHFDAAYGNKNLDDQIRKQCPGK